MEIHNAQEDVPLPSPVIQKLHSLLRHLQEKFRLKDLDPLTIVLVDDRRIHDLNLKFLGRDRPTNVLAFDLGEEREIYISVPTAQREFGKDSVPEALAFYAFHGILHLAGYDHLQSDRRQEMETMEQEAWRIIQRWFSSNP